MSFAKGFTLLLRSPCQRPTSLPFHLLSFFSFFLLGQFRGGSAFKILIIMQQFHFRVFFHCSWSQHHSFVVLARSKYEAINIVYHQKNQKAIQPNWSAYHVFLLK